MHPADIQAAIKKAGSNQKSVALQCCVSQTMVGHVIAGRSKSRRVAVVIAAIINQPLERVWPGRYVDRADS